MGGGGGGINNKNRGVEVDKRGGRSDSKHRTSEMYKFTRSWPRVQSLDFDVQAVIPYVIPDSNMRFGVI